MISLFTRAATVDKVGIDVFRVSGLSVPTPAWLEAHAGEFQEVTQTIITMEDDAGSYYAVTEPIEEVARQINAARLQQSGPVYVIHRGDDIKIELPLSR